MGADGQRGADERGSAAAGQWPLPVAWGLWVVRLDRPADVVFRDNAAERSL